MIRANGVHHLAVSTANIKQQIEFMNDVLGDASSSRSTGCTASKAPGTPS